MVAQAASSRKPPVTSPRSLPTHARGTALTRTDRAEHEKGGIHPHSSGRRSGTYRHSDQVTQKPGSTALPRQPSRIIPPRGALPHGDGGFGPSPSPAPPIEAGPNGRTTTRGRGSGLAGDVGTTRRGAAFSSSSPPCPPPDGLGEEHAGFGAGVEGVERQRRPAPFCPPAPSRSLDRVAADRLCADAVVHDGLRGTGCPRGAERGVGCATLLTPLWTRSSSSSASPQLTPPSLNA